MAAVATLSRFPDLVEASHGTLTNGTLDRVRRATHATNVDTLEELAKVFGVEPWQLLVPTLHAEPARESGKAKVKLSGLPEWPFARIDRKKWLALSPEQRAFIEGMVAHEIALLETPSAEDLEAFASAHLPHVKKPAKRKAA